MDGKLLITRSDYQPTNFRPQRACSSQIGRSLRHFLADYDYRELSRVRVSISNVKLDTRLLILRTHGDQQVRDALGGRHSHWPTPNGPMNEFVKGNCRRCTRSERLRVPINRRNFDLARKVLRLKKALQPIGLDCGDNVPPELFV